ncbi:YciI family protein [Halobacillus mangrovi]|uniref:YciI family protein n=1 Tax=Halobacillus mangrovi TaxID=402384 RepID=UPI003D99E1AF
MEYLYRLTLIKRLLKEENWTEDDEKVVSEHFHHLKSWTEAGKVVMAGRTTNEDVSQFGIVIFHADNAQQAERLMGEEPAVKKGIMKGELFPFRIALQG